MVAQGQGVVAQGVERHDFRRAFPGVIENRALEIVAGVQQQHVRRVGPDLVNQRLAASDAALLRPLMTRTQFLVARKRLQMAMGVVGVQQGEGDGLRGRLIAGTRAAA